MAEFNVDKSALPDSFDSPVRPNLTLPESDQAEDYWNRRESFESGGNVQIGSNSGQTVNKNFGGVSKSRPSINPKFEAWITKHLGENYVGPYYDTLEEIFEKPGRQSIGAGDLIFPGRSMRYIELQNKGLLDTSGKWNQQKVAELYDKEQATEAADALKQKRSQIVKEVMGTLPTAQKPTYPSNTLGKPDNEPMQVVPNKKAYWDQYYDLPQEARSYMQPGVKKAYYDIVDKALKSFGV